MAKRETNVQRRKRESERRTTILTAKLVAESISLIRRTKPELVSECCEAELKRGSRVLLEQMFRDFCLCGNAPSKFLRLVADFLDGKPPPYSSGEDWYDDKIKAAYEEAFNRILVKSGLPRGHVIQVVARPDAVKRLETWMFGNEIPPPPVFSEFLGVFREQNPELHGASDSSLRRSLKRLGLFTRPDKRGRPTGKRDRKPRLTR